MAGLPLDTIQKYDRLPENGTAATYVGDPDTLWEDGSDATYVDQWGYGFTDPWGHAYARVPGLTMTPEQAATVTQVVVRVRVRVVPGANPVEDSVLLPHVTVDPLRIGGGYPQLESREWMVGDWQSLSLNGTAWAWLDVPMALFDANYDELPVQQFLTDPRDKFVMFSIETGWNDEHFLIAEVEVLGAPLLLPTTLPPRRVYPRDDGRAASSTPRRYPASKAVQQGNRIASGYV